VTVTLRRERMYDFLYKLINIVLPRVRDFRGISDRSFDGNGNYSMGITEHTIFPEIKIDDVVKTHGVQITIVTSNKSDEQSKALLEAFNFPFKKKKEQIN
jgi:large subunit ribosomal protein L5